MRCVASRCVVSRRDAPKVRSFDLSKSRSCGRLVWDANHAAFSAVGPTARGPTFPPPFLPCCSAIPIIFAVLLSFSLFLSSSSLSASRSAKMHVRMLATLLLSLQYSIVSYVIYERRGKGKNAKMIHIFLYHTRINL